MRNTFRKRWVVRDYDLADGQPTSFERRFWTKGGATRLSNFLNKWSPSRRGYETRVERLP